MSKLKHLKCILLQPGDVYQNIKKTSRNSTSWKWSWGNKVVHKHTHWKGDKLLLKLWLFFEYYLHIKLDVLQYMSMKNDSWIETHSPYSRCFLHCRRKPMCHFWLLFTPYLTSKNIKTYLVNEFVDRNTYKPLQPDLFLFFLEYTCLWSIRFSSAPPFGKSYGGRSPTWGSLWDLSITCGKVSKSVLYWDSKLRSIQ